MTDTQPTKFCVDCAFVSTGAYGSKWCENPNRKGTLNMVYGHVNYENNRASHVRERECHGAWFTPRPSILQRIINKAKRWFK